MQRAMILILGGTGFLGQSMAHWFLREGRSVRVVSRHSLPDAQLPGLDSIQADIADIPQRPDILKGVDTVIHLVHSTKPACSMRDIPHDIVSNLPASVRLMQAVADSKVGRMIFVSSGGTVYGIPRYLPMDEDHPTNPICSYGITKLAIEKYLGMFSALNPLFSGITLRLSNPYGPLQPGNTGQGVIAHFLHSIRLGRPLEIWGDGSITRDFMHIDDVLRAISQTLDHGLGSGVYNLGSEQGVSINKIITVMRSVTGREVIVKHHPGRTIDIPHVVLCTAKFRQAVNWRPEVSLEAGIAQVWRQLQNPSK